MLKELQKKLKSHHAIALIGFLILILAVSQFSERKNSHPSHSLRTEPFVSVNSPLEPASIGGGAEASPTLGASCGAKQESELMAPADLLPAQKVDLADGNNVQNVSLLSAGYHRGINTVGNSLRNANLQLRSEPANPQTKVSPWMNSTIEPDLMRTPLELGCGQ